MKLICTNCGHKEQEPFDVGDACVCGWSFSPMPRLKEIGNIETVIAEMAGLILDLFEQGCLIDGKYNHQCISAYENAQDWLLKHGVIDIDQCVYI